MIKRIFALATVCILGSACLALPACGPKQYDGTLPSLSAEDGWRITMDDDFTTYETLEEVWENTYWHPATPHGKRNYEYWCDEMVGLDPVDGSLTVHSERQNDHVCDVCPAEGVFTGGIMTENTFNQAYGYFEATVKVPLNPGMWSAFWLHTDNEGKIGNKGLDGTEIDIYESAFSINNPTKTGNALHYDSYSAPYYRLADNVTDVGYNLYDGVYHTFALHWTPEFYAFFVDGNNVWTTDNGGVSRVAEYMLLTVEIRDKPLGPYGEELGTFENDPAGGNDFHVKNVRAFQNAAYEPHIKADSEYRDKKSLIDNSKLAAIILASLTGAGAVVALTVWTVRKIKKTKSA